MQHIATYCNILQHIATLFCQQITPRLRNEWIETTNKNGLKQQRSHAPARRQGTKSPWHGGVQCLFPHACHCFATRSTATLDLCPNQTCGVDHGPIGLLGPVYHIYISYISHRYHIYHMYQRCHIYQKQHRDHIYTIGIIDTIYIYIIFNTYIHVYI